MTVFKVLDRTENVHRHRILEASAGTGKTFAIENMVVRLLIESKEKEPLLIENILVVTFTKMAALELKERIHANLEKCLGLLKKSLSGEDTDQCPDYLSMHIEKGIGAVLKAKRALERALFSYDRAQIFTIHGFCWRMLKNYAIQAEISLDASSREDRSLSLKQQMQVVRDFLGSELIPSIYSAQQLSILMKRVGRKDEKLQKELLYEINKGIVVQQVPSFSDYVVQFCDKMKELKQEYGLEGPRLLADFIALVPSYKELCNKDGKVHPEVMKKFERFAAIFDREVCSAKDLEVLIEDGIFPLEAFDECKLKLRSKMLPEGTLHYPQLLNVFREHLKPLIMQARSENSIFARLAGDCQKFFNRYQEKEELFGHHDLLVQMRKAIDKAVFAEQVRKSYSAVIVDEFQDTDPIQWEIFALLFATEQWKGYLSLVGDPKQSIYAFRQADIYTYIKAAASLGTDSIASLDTNFRSRSSLINALNALFSSVDNLFPLPRLSEQLLYRNVEAGRKNFLSLEHESPSLRFWQVHWDGKSKKSFEEVEANSLFPRIVREILTLKKEERIRFGQIAILVADRYQAGRLREYFNHREIPVKSQKGVDISASQAVHEMRDLLNGVLHYGSRSEFNVALAGRLIGMTHQELLFLENDGKLFPLMQQFDHLRRIFFERGFSFFYTHFMRTCWHGDGKSVLERLLSQSGYSGFYREWDDLADLLIGEEKKGNLLPEGIVAFLDDLKELSLNEDERIKAYVDPDEDGVTVLTTHVSKGLEFDIVISLGMIRRKDQSDKDLIPIIQNDTCTLCVVDGKEDQRYRKFCEEIDAEKMRQLYVALTRAKERLYVPVVIDDSDKPVPVGGASPLELFIAKLDKPPTDYEGWYQRISSEEGTTLANFVARFPHVMSLEILSDEPAIDIDTFLTCSVKLYPPNCVTIPVKNQVIQSFTSLSHVKNGLLQVLEKGISAPHDFACEGKSEHTLPSGNETGIILHRIFEMLPFDAVKPLSSFQELIPFVSPYLKGTPFAQWEGVVARLVYSTLKTPLKGDAGFCLCDVNPKRMYREMEFLYPCDEKHGMFDGVMVKPGFFKGVVDVFFEHQGKYYIVDWKSNWLGPTQDYYSEKYMEDAMTTNHYDLQAAIYREAFEKYLKVFDKRPFIEVFGGVYYLFVRGVSETTGIISVGSR